MTPMIHEEIGGGVGGNEAVIMRKRATSSGPEGGPNINGTSIENP